MWIVHVNNIIVNCGDTPRILSKHANVQLHVNFVNLYRESY